MTQKEIAWLFGAMSGNAVYTYAYVLLQNYVADAATAGSYRKH